VGQDGERYKDRTRHFCVGVRTDAGLSRQDRQRRRSIGVDRRAWRVAWRFKGAKIKGYRPAEWKGQVPKHISRKRLEARLTDKEKDKVAKNATHDAWDAIGIGAYYFRKQGIDRWRRSR
jgi:hypothetical protein